MYSPIVPDVDGLPLWHPASCSAFCRSFYNSIVKYPFGLAIQVPKYIQISFFSICFAHLSSNSQVKQFTHLKVYNRTMTMQQLRAKQVS